MARSLARIRVAVAGDPAQPGDLGGRVLEASRAPATEDAAMSGTSGTQYPGGWKPVRYEQRCLDRRQLLGDALRDAVETCRSRPEVVRLLVFGSYARGDVSPWSDLDLLVVAEDDPRAAVEAIFRRGALGDVIGVQANEWQQRLQRNPFGETILREATQAYARSES